MTAKATVRRADGKEVPGSAMDARGARPSARKLANRLDHGFYRWVAIAAFAVVVVGCSSCRRV